MSTAEDLARQAHALRRKGDSAASLQLYHQACDAFGRDDRGRAHCLRHIGDLALELGHKDEADAALRKAEALYRTSVDDVLGLANTQRLLALLDGGKTAWREARLLYERAANDTGLDLRAALEECDRHLADPGAT